MIRQIVRASSLAGVVLLAATTISGAGAADAAAPAANAKQPPASCLAELDRLSRAIPTEESGPALRRQGLKIRSPIVVADGVVTDTAVDSAARIRMMIDSNGQVVPGSVEVQQASGDPKLALALTRAVPATLSFELAAAADPAKPFAFTTVYVVCAAH